MLQFIDKFEQTIHLTTDDFDLRGTVPLLTSDKSITAAICLAEHFDANPEQHLAGTYLIDVERHRFTGKIKYNVYYRLNE